MIVQILFLWLLACVQCVPFSYQTFNNTDGLQFNSAKLKLDGCPLTQSQINLSEQNPLTEEMIDTVTNNLSFTSNVKQINISCIFVAELEYNYEEADSSLQRTIPIQWQDGFKTSFTFKIDTDQATNYRDSNTMNTILLALYSGNEIINLDLGKGVLAVQVTFSKTSSCDEIAAYASLLDQPFKVDNENLIVYPYRFHKERLHDVIFFETLHKHDHPSKQLKEFKIFNREFQNLSLVYLPFPSVEYFHFLSGSKLSQSILHGCKNPGTLVLYLDSTLVFATYICLSKLFGTKSTKIGIFGRNLDQDIKVQISDWDFFEGSFWDTYEPTYLNIVHNDFENTKYQDALLRRTTEYN